MKQLTIIIFGASGGIGGAARTAFLEAGHRVISVSRSQCDFNNENGEAQLVELLNGARADVVVNSVGFFANGAHNTHHETFNINFGSNWSIIRYYYAMKEISKPVKIIMVGSSSYSEGKSLYPLYSASKAALYNLWQSAVDMFKGSNISVNLINPMRTKTNMNANHYNSALAYHHPTEVGAQILQMIDMDGSNCINMTLEEKK